jgi:hypothetical protein
MGTYLPGWAGPSSNYLEEYRHEAKNQGWKEHSKKNLATLLDTKEQKNLATFLEMKEQKNLAKFLNRKENKSLATFLNRKEKKNLAISLNKKDKRNLATFLTRKDTKNLATFLYRKEGMDLATFLVMNEQSNVNLGTDLVQSYYPRSSYTAKLLHPKFLCLKFPQFKVPTVLSSRGTKAPTVAVLTLSFPTNAKFLQFKIPLDEKFLWLD